MPETATAIKVTLPDGTVREVAPGTTPLEVAREIGPRLAKAALAARVDEQIVDIERPLRRDARLAILTDRDPEALDVLRHSTAHATAQAVQELFPGTKVGQGPVIEGGFYYDFERDEPFSDANLEAIETRMVEIVDRDLKIERIEMPREEAIAFFGKEQEPYKVYFATTKGGETVSVYRQGEWNDFCLGPHLPSTGRLGVFKLLSVAGAYWLGNENNRMLQRIYGTAFFRKEDLARHLELLEEARKRDHRKLGKELRLFSFHPEAPASPFFLPRGAAVYTRLVSEVRDFYKRYGYAEVITPQIFEASLWKTSGHYDHYAANMFFTQVDDREYAVKPMNCPSHCLIYSEDRHSFRDLPIRLADFGRLHRNERSGVTAGLTRVRSFSQDDAHIFCTPDQVAAEVGGVVDMIIECYGMFGFEVGIELSTRPDDRAGDDALWDRAEAALKEALDRRGDPYVVKEGDGAFYGPKIDFLVKDAIGREHQLGTCQLDYVLPERFGLRFIDSEDKEQRPVMIHRAMLGSLERFIGILIEHCAGAFPYWLAPEQVRVLSISAKSAEYAGQVQSKLAAAGLRATADVRNEKIGAKIREAQLDKIPAMLVVGDREASSDRVAVRLRKLGDQGAVLVTDFISRARAWDESRALLLDWPAAEGANEES